MYQLHQEQHALSLRLAQESILKEACVNSWVMTSPNDAFVKLPNERTLYASPPRTSLDISTPNNFPGTQPFSAKSDAGVVYITNQRIVYLPATPKPELQSFSCPILNLQDSYVRAPFFGANYWTALCKPVSGGNIPSAIPAVELRMTFREGGAYDFHSTFEQIKERLHQAYMNAREDGRIGQTSTNLGDMHLEQLPAYEPTTATNGPSNAVEARNDIANASTSREVSRSPINENFAPPNEPPPGYEEAQVQAVGIDLEQRLRDGADARR